MNQPPAPPHRPAVSLALGLILAIYACVRVAEAAPTHIPQLLAVAFDVLSALAFALVHGALHYRLRGILVFAGICIVVGNISENLSVATGFPFGHYYFKELMGPKLFHVPILLGLAYIGMAYVSWTLARLIVGKSDAPVTGTRIVALVALPLVASFIMVAWDLAQDPVWGTVLHGWAWLDGGPWFGVPISNYLGWYGTVFTIYLLFALYLRSSPAPAIPNRQASWSAALLFYVLCAAGNVLQAFHNAVPEIVSDPAGKQWQADDITSASALVSIFVMGAFAAIAWIRLAEQQKSTTD
jgi:putative membrane protein